MSESPILVTGGAGFIGSALVRQLVHDSDHSTYVAERNLEADTELQPIAHPMLAQFLGAFENNRYRRLERDN